MCPSPAVTSIFLVMGYGFQAAAHLAGSFGLVAVLPLLPVIYLAAGSALCLVTILLKSVLLPKTKLDQPIKLFSPDFLRWWLVHRFIDLTNVLFLRHFRGTVVMNYYCSLLVNACPSLKFLRVPSVRKCLSFSHTLSCMLVSISWPGASDVNWAFSSQD